MAIKGKSRKRSRPRGSALPPKPAVGARKTPLPYRRDVKRAAVIVLAVAALLGGLRVWQNDSRFKGLRKYNAAITLAQETFIRHLQPNSPSGFDENIKAFTEGRIGGPAIIALATLWEKDFKAAEDKVRKLKAPHRIASDSEFMIAQGISGYVAVTRLLNVAGQVRQLADAEKDKRQKDALLQKVQVILQHADEWRKQRADVIYTRGATKLRELNIEYGLEQRQPQQTGTTG